LRTANHGRGDSIYESGGKLIEEEKNYKINPQLNINVAKI
jgi:hypothetical protein